MYGVFNRGRTSYKGVGLFFFSFFSFFFIRLGCFLSLFFCLFSIRLLLPPVCRGWMPSFEGAWLCRHTIAFVSIPSKIYFYGLPWATCVTRGRADLSPLWVHFTASDVVLTWNSLMSSWTNRIIHLDHSPCHALFHHVSQWQMNVYACLPEIHFCSFVFWLMVFFGGCCFLATHVFLFDSF